MEFEKYLISKKIDSVRFEQKEPTQWNSWKKEFDQLHPKSFTARKLYLINAVRRRFSINPHQESAEK